MESQPKWQRSRVVGSAVNDDMTCCLRFDHCLAAVHGAPGKGKIAATLESILSSAPSLPVSFSSEPPGACAPAFPRSAFIWWLPLGAQGSSTPYWL